jgi:hypothetical protein
MHYEALCITRELTVVASSRFAKPPPPSQLHRHIAADQKKKISFMHACFTRCFFFRPLAIMNINHARSGCDDENHTFPIPVPDGDIAGIRRDW